MRKALVVFVTGFSFAILCSGVGAQPLPKSGSIDFQTGYRVSADVITVADKHLLGHGSAIGVTFNDRGSGPLHGGPSDCLFTFFSVEGSLKYKIYCAFGDADGDRIFTDADGTASADPNEGSHGTNVLVGGTGKYAGIRGKGPWKCRNAGANGELHCNQRFDYQLP